MVPPSGGSSIYTSCGVVATPEQTNQKAKADFLIKSNF